MTTHLRNICIIAHVDHGKTTLVDFMLRQSGQFARLDAGAPLIMDSMDLERERGITISAKNASVRYGKWKINIVDTPGHSDFGGEVERSLGMADGAILLVDAAEGPLPQTRFVLQKALAAGLKIILLINKLDRPECADEGLIHEVVDKTFALFIDLGATEEQATFPILYACGRAGWATADLTRVPEILAGRDKADLGPLFDRIVKYFPSPRVVESPHVQMLVSNLAWSDYVGQMSVGRIRSGSIRRNQQVFCHTVTAEGAPKVVSFTVNRLYCYDGLAQRECDTLEAGEVGLISGCDTVMIGDTIVGATEVEALPRIHVERPTLAMVFSINTSPFSGQDGDAIQSRKLRERLLREVRHNVALAFEETEAADQFRVLGRGELQFGILIEQIRREGSEFMVGRPEVLYRTAEDGSRLEPMERIILDLPALFAGDVTEMFQRRKGIMTKYEGAASSGSISGGARVRLEFEIPTRGLLGMRSTYLTLTKGEGLFTSELIGYGPWKGELPHRINGSLVCDREGKTVEYALFSLEQRGILFKGPGERVYEGMIIGEASQVNDLNVNPCREKKLTNVRASGAEILVTLSGIRRMPLERCIEWIDDAEWIEITPKEIRLRKKVLASNFRTVIRKTGR